MIFHQLGELGHPHTFFGFHGHLEEAIDGGLPFVLDPAPFVQLLRRQDAALQTEIHVGHTPALMVTDIGDILGKRLVFWRVQIALGGGPVVELELKRRLPGEAVGDELANFLLGNDQAFDAESQEAFGALGDVGTRHALRAAVAVLSILRPTQGVRPWRGLSNDDFLEQKAGDQ